MTAARGQLFVAPSSSIGLGSRSYDIQWDIDQNADELELVGIENSYDAVGAISYKAKVRHPFRNASPLLTVEFQGTDGLTGFRLGGHSSQAAEDLLKSLLLDSWTWNSAAREPVSFSTWAKKGEPAWRFVAEMISKTNPPSPQPVVCIHSPKPEMLAKGATDLEETFTTLLPAPSPAADTLVRSSTDLALLLKLPLTSVLVSVWNSAFSRPRILTCQPEETRRRLKRSAKDAGVKFSNVASETDLPTT
jgi:hypothetical protein